MKIFAQPALLALLLLIPPFVASAGRVIWRDGFESEGCWAGHAGESDSQATSMITGSRSFRGARSLLHSHHGSPRGLTNECVIPVTLEKGKTYTLSVWFRCDLVAEGNAQGIRIWLEAPKRIAQAGLDLRVAKGGWQSLAVTFQAPEDAENPRLALATSGAYALIWCDEAALTAGDAAAPLPEGAERDARDAGEFFVCARGGDDRNDGRSPDAAWGNLAAALARCGGAATVTLLPGEYPDAANLTLPAGRPGRPTCVRAMKNGTVVLGAQAVLESFTPDGVYPYLASAAVAAPPLQVYEQDTGRLLRHMPTAADANELAGSFFFDGSRVHIHASDSGDPGLHSYSILKDKKVGLRLADHSRVEGLAFRGFGWAGVEGKNVADTGVSGCFFYGNGYGLHLQNVTGCAVRGNEAWMNCPMYAGGAQIQFSGASTDADSGSSNVTVADNIVRDSPTIGVRFYGNGFRRCLARGNLVYGNAGGGLYFKTPEAPELAGERNVCLDNGFYDFGAFVSKSNTFRQIAIRAPGSGDLVAGDCAAERFADPAYRDFRLQEDSPARGKGPDGSDLGAFPYRADVIYVAPGGTTGPAAAAWRRRGKPWRTPPRICAPGIRFT